MAGVFPVVFQKNHHYILFCNTVCLFLEISWIFNFNIYLFYCAVKADKAGKNGKKNLVDFICFHSGSIFTVFCRISYVLSGANTGSHYVCLTGKGGEYKCRYYLMRYLT